MHAQLMFSQLIGSQIANDGFMSSYIVVLSGLPLISCMAIKIDEGWPGVIYCQRLVWTNIYYMRWISANHKINISTGFHSHHNTSMYTPPVII